MMKKYYILIFCLLTGFGGFAQTANQGIRVSGVTAFESDGEVRVSFTATFDSDAAGRGETRVYVPVLTDGDYRVSLPAMEVSDRNFRRTAGKAADRAMLPEFRSGNGTTLEYSAAVEAQAWMQGGSLYLECALNRCAGVEEAAVSLADDLRLYDEPSPREVITEVRRFAPKTMADSLSMIFPFVLPESLFDPEDPFKIYDEEREGSVIVYFRVSRYDIDAGYRDNRQTLLNLRASAEMILRDRDSRVERVVVAGFASPEGSFEQNDVLAFNRAVAVKHYLLQHTDLADNQVWVHNGSVDWRGLRLLVSRSEMPHKESILSIIDTVPAGSGRLGQLQRLDGGAPYRYMLAEFFPLLRNGAFIKIYYSNVNK